MERGLRCICRVFIAAFLYRTKTRLMLNTKVIEESEGTLADLFALSYKQAKYKWHEEDDFFRSSFFITGAMLSPHYKIS